MFGKLMNRYYYGKSGQGDFTKEDLPKNRWELFGSTLHTRFAGLVKLNLMYMIIFIPAMIIIGRALLYLYQGLSAAAQYAAGEITESAVTDENFMEFATSVLYQSLLLWIPAFLITGPVSCGVAYVCRNWARDEHAFVWIDFKDAIKANWKQGLLISLISSLVPIVIFFTSYFYGNMAVNSFLFRIPQMIVIIMGVIWFMMSIYLYPLAVTYELKFKDLLRNAFLLAVGRLPQSLGLVLLSLLPTVLFGVIFVLAGQYGTYALLAWGLYYILLGFALIRFVYAAYSNAVFDRYINSRMEGVEVNRGLYKEDPEDADDADKVENAAPAELPDEQK